MRRAVGSPPPLGALTSRAKTFGLRRSRINGQFWDYFKLIKNGRKVCNVFPEFSRARSIGTVALYYQTQLALRDSWWGKWLQHIWQCHRALKYKEICSWNAIMIETVHEGQLSNLIFNWADMRLLLRILKSSMAEWSVSIWVVCSLSLVIGLSNNNGY